jgi:hypothetical protein
VKDNEICYQVRNGCAYHYFIQSTTSSDEER